jgi:outer membrane immunogenic protein
LAALQLLIWQLDSCDSAGHCVFGLRQCRRQRHSYGLVAWYRAWYGFLPNWSAKIEYNFEDFGSRTLNFPLAVSATGATIPVINVPVAIKDFDHIIKAGVNYRW